MAISVDQVTHIISIPKDYLSPVVGQLYELDTNQLRLDLKTWEATEEGRTEDRTHDHNSTYIVFGVEYDRKFEIIVCILVNIDVVFYCRILG